MATYRLPQFNTELIDPKIESVAARYQIGADTASVEVVLSTLTSKLFGVVFEGFPNTDVWGDDDVMRWAEEKLQEHLFEELERLNSTENDEHENDG
jgi:hypothetical protein